MTGMATPVGLGNIITMKWEMKIFETQYLYDELIDTLTYYKYEYEKVADKILIKSKECLLDTSDIFYEEKEIFSYDSLGRETQYQKFRSDNSIYVNRATDYGSLSRIRKFYLADGSVKQIDSMKINSEGKTILSNTYKNAVITKTTNCEYNPEGQLLSELQISELQKRFFEYKYNELGKEIYFSSLLNDTLNFHEKI